MGILTRLLVPRTVRRAAHPVRTARRAVTPKPIKRARRTLYVATNPFGAAEGALENAVVDALRPRRRRPATRRGSSAPARSTVEREARFRDAGRAAAVFEAASTLHEGSVVSPRPLKAPNPPAVDEGQVRRQLERNLLEGIGLFKREERKALRALAARTAASEVARELERREALRREQQSELDRAHARLIGNDPTAVWWAVSDALQALPLEATVIAIEGDRIDLRTDFPDLELVPESRPTVTPGGRPSTRRYTKTERNALYAGALASAVLATLRTAAAAAPGIHELRLVALRTSAVGEDPLLAAVASREGLAAAAGTDPFTALGAVENVVIQTKGRTHELSPLPRTGLVDELLTEAERRTPPPSQPIDVSAMIARQSAQAAEFTTRIAALRPNLNTTTNRVSQAPPSAKAPEPRQSRRPLPFPPPKTRPTDPPKPDQVDPPISEPPSPRASHAPPPAKGPDAQRSERLLPFPPPKADTTNVLEPDDDLDLRESSRDNRNEALWSKQATWLGLASIPLVVIAVGILPALAAIALGVRGLLRGPSKIERRRFWIAIVSGVLTTSLWIAIVAAAALH